MNLRTELYITQVERWPGNGRHILAQFDERSIVVYQAYKPSIGHFAARHGHFGGEFQFDRMSWIKPNFLWMMFRSGWGTKPGQEITLAVKITREGFDSILAAAVHSSYVPELYARREDWKKELSASAVRLQWDPDHDPAGSKVPRRAVQLGLKDDMLYRYAREWVIEIEDISDFVAAQREHASARDYQSLEIPREDIYPVNDAVVGKKLGIQADKE